MSSDMGTVDVAPVVTSGSPKKSRKRLILWIVTAVLVLVVVLAFVIGFVAVVFKSPSQRIVLVGTVCDSVVIDRYNTIMNEYYSDNRSEGVKKLSDLASEIGKRAGNEQDASCLFIRYRSALLNNQYTVAKDSFEKLSQQVKVGNSADTRLDGLSSLASMQRTLAASDPSVKDPDD